MRKQVLFIAIFAIILSGCNGQPATEQPTDTSDNVTPVETTTPADTPITVSDEEFDFEVVDQKAKSVKKQDQKDKFEAAIEKSESLNDCNAIEDEYYQNLCTDIVARELAFKNLDAKLCENISSSDEVQDCKDKVAIGIELEEEDV